MSLTKINALTRALKILSVTAERYSFVQSWRWETPNSTDTGSDCAVNALVPE